MIVNFDRFLSLEFDFYQFLLKNIDMYMYVYGHFPLASAILDFNAGKTPGTRLNIIIVTKPLLTPYTARDKKSYVCTCRTMFEVWLLNSLKVQNSLVRNNFLQYSGNELFSWFILCIPVHHPAVSM